LKFIAPLLQEVQEEEDIKDPLALQLAVKNVQEYTIDAHQPIVLD